MNEMVNADIVDISDGSHPLSTYAKFTKKLTFLTPWYAHVRVSFGFYVKFQGMALRCFILYLFLLLYSTYNDIRV